MLCQRLVVGVFVFFVSKTMSDRAEDVEKEEDTEYASKDVNGRCS